MISIPVSLTKDDLRHLWNDKCRGCINASSIELEGRKFGAGSLRFVTVVASNKAGKYVGQMLFEPTGDDGSRRIEFSQLPGIRKPKTEKPASAAQHDKAE